MTAEAARMSRRLPTLVRRRDSPASSTRSYAPTTMNAEGPLMDSALELFGLRCVYAGDISSGQDALARDHYGAA